MTTRSPEFLPVYSKDGTDPKAPVVEARSFNRIYEDKPYRTGDGDTPLTLRPGALDFKKCPSRGLK